MSLDVVVGSPLFLLPTRVGGSDGLRADLGRMSVRNSLVRRTEAASSVGGGGGAPLGSRECVLDAIRVAVEAMHLDSFGASVASVAGGAVHMLRDVSLDVLVERGIGPSVGRPLDVNCSAGEMECDVSQLQYELMMRVVLQNLAGHGDVFERARQAAAAK